jgi:hypothetical protein
VALHVLQHLDEVVVGLVCVVFVFELAAFAATPDDEMQ